MGPLTEQAVETLRLLRDAFGVVFKIKESREREGDKSVFLSCLGVGYKNTARRVT